MSELHPHRDCADCTAKDEAFKRHYAYGISQIRAVLECHALGAEVIALKDPKYERLNALHAITQLQRIEQRLYEVDALPVGGPEPTDQEASE